MIRSLSSTDFYKCMGWETNQAFLKGDATEQSRKQQIPERRYTLTSEEFSH